MGDRDLASSFATIVQEALRRIAGAAVDDVRARHELGVALHAVRYCETADGARTLQHLANQLGVDVSALRRCARVAETIDANQLTAILQLRTAKGLPLTWSHLETLSLERNIRQREALAVAAAAEDLSVRALSSRVRRKRQSSST